jgi:hypothetical protein
MMTKQIHSSPHRRRCCHLLRQKSLLIGRIGLEFGFWSWRPVETPPPSPDIRGSVDQVSEQTSSSGLALTAKAREKQNLGYMCFTNPLCAQARRQQLQPSSASKTRWTGSWERGYASPRRWRLNLIPDLAEFQPAAYRRRDLSFPIDRSLPVDDAVFSSWRENPEWEERWTQVGPSFCEASPHPNWQQARRRHLPFPSRCDLIWETKMASDGPKKPEGIYRLTTDGRPATAARRKATACLLPWFSFLRPLGMGDVGARASSRCPTERSPLLPRPFCG